MLLERIVSWEVQCYVNDLGELTDNLGGQQFHGVLAIILQKNRSKRRTKGSFRVVQSP